MSNIYEKKQQQLLLDALIMGEIEIRQTGRKQGKFM